MVSKRKILIVPDKFKGSLTASQVANSIEEAIKRRMVHISDLEIEKIPMADGGDGSLDVMYDTLSRDPSSKAHLVEVDCCDPLRRPLRAPLLLFRSDGEQCAFIEMAKCSGLTLLKEEERDPLKTDTFGLGLMIRAAAEAGASRIIIGIGGSATNDMGYGIWGEEGSISLGEIVRMCDTISFQVACDVENPLLGPNGATMVYAPQKGANWMTLPLLEQRMEIYAEKAQSLLKPIGGEFAVRAAHITTIPGGGAAGGIGAAFYSFFKAELLPGWQLFSQMLSLEERIASAETIITGEGRFDSQSLSGKLIDGIASLCRKYNKRPTVVCGENLVSPELLKTHKIGNVYQLMDICPDRQTCISSAEMLLKGADRTLIEVGCDEAGRGCLAGPVFAAAVVLPKGFSHPLLNDSKQLSALQREELREIIEREAVAWSVAAIDAQEIDRINILNASIKGMHGAIDNLKDSKGEKVAPSLIFVDGNRFSPYGKIPHHCIIKGDGKLSCIAAASILAKTHRDEYMRRLAAEYPQYGWEENMAYPTAKHREAIALYGLTPYHRRSFNLTGNQLNLHI
jgi:ribonuclease HII